MPPRQLPLALALGTLMTTSAASATYSIVVFDAETQMFGVALSTCAAAAATTFNLEISDTYAFAPDHGAAIFQADSLFYPNLHLRAEELLAGGMAPSEILTTLTAEQPAGMPRAQIGIVDAQERWASHSGAETLQFTCDAMRDGCDDTLAGKRGSMTYSVQGNMLTGREVLDGVVAGAADRECDVVETLMKAIEGGATSPEGKLQGDARCTPFGVPTDMGFIQVRSFNGTVLAELQIKTPCACAAECIFPPCEPTGCECPEANAVANLREAYDAWRVDHACGTIEDQADVNENDGEGGCTVSQSSPRFSGSAPPLLALAMGWLRARRSQRAATRSPRASRKSAARTLAITGLVLVASHCASEDPESTNAGPPCAPTNAECTAVRSDCLAIADNTGKDTFALRLNQLMIAKPPALANLIVNTLVQQAAVPDWPACNLRGNGLFSWLIEFDVPNNTIRTGGAKPVENPAEGYCFASGDIEAGAGSFSIAPAVLDGTLDEDGKFDFQVPVVNVPLFQDAAATTAIVLPLRGLRIHDATVSDDHNCIGKYNAEGLDPANDCDDNLDNPAFVPDGTLTAFITMEEADSIQVKELGSSLCVMLTGAADDSESDKRCRRDENDQVDAKGDWCSATNSAATEECADAFFLEAAISGSAVPVRSDCPG